MPAKQNAPTEKSEKQASNAPNLGGYNHHVVRKSDGWVVIREGSSTEIARGKTQNEAISIAKEIALQKHAEVIVHGRSGKIAGRETFVDDVWELDSAALDSDTIQKYIDFKFYGKRPHIRGRRLLVSMIAANEQADQWQIPELAADFGLTVEAVLAAILYYREHKEEIDLQDREEQQLFDEMYEIHGKKKP